MATVKLATLAIRTIAKPISTRLKHEARQHPFFRRICVELAQRMYRTEMKLGTVVLGQPPRTVKPLSETRAIDNGANFIAESFLFSVAASLIVAETWRSSNKESRRREGVADQLEDLAVQVQALTADLARVSADVEEKWNEERTKNAQLSLVLQRLVDIGLRGGLVDFEDTPLRVPIVRTPSDVQELVASPDKRPPDLRNDTDDGTRVESNPEKT